MTVREFWFYLEKLDDINREESGENKKLAMLSDPKFKEQ